MSAADGFFVALFCVALLIVATIAAVAFAHVVVWMWGWL